MNLFKRKVKTIVSEHTTLNGVETINDLFTRDDINEYLAELSENKSKIKHAIVIYEDYDDGLHFRVTNDCKIVHALGLIEIAKGDLIKQSEDDDDGD